MTWVHIAVIYLQVFAVTDLKPALLLTSTYASLTSPYMMKQFSDAAR